MFNASPKRTPMKSQDASVRKHNFNVVFEGYSEKEVIEEANRCLACHNPTCVQGCPINNNIPQFISKVKEGDFAGAFALIREKSCMSDICGTVCPHEKQCSGNCIRGNKQEPVNIGAIEAYITNYAYEHKLIDDKIKNVRKEKVAVIGSGPAGLSFALEAAIEGFQVTVFEKENYLGGILRWGIPSYRLDENYLNRFIERLKKLNVSFVLNSDIKDMSEIRENFDYIFVGIGAPNNNQTKVNFEGVQGVYYAKEFLNKINLQNKNENGQKLFSECGKKVMIVGGGNAAMDVARNAVRLPQVEEVTIVYRRTENEMPACSEELNQAKEEGIKFLTLTDPVSFISKDGKLSQVECAIMELGEPDDSGRRRPIPSDKPNIILDVDTVVLALGFSNDQEFIKSNPDIEADKWGVIKVGGDRKTNVEKIFAGGDATTGASTVVAAMKAGRDAAKSIVVSLEK